MVTEADWQAWQFDDFRPYLDIVFDAFGPNRIMFGSDWPVCTVAASYEQVVNIVADYTRQLSKLEQSKVWGGTAQEFYGVN
jgi:L-fuconolactonase